MNHQVEDLPEAEKSQLTGPPPGSREEALERAEELAAWLKSVKSELPMITRKLVLHGAATKMQALARRSLYASGVGSNSRGRLWSR